jgi:RNA polymerase sigma-70 factor (ECF subfamily)
MPAGETRRLLDRAREGSDAAVDAFYTRCARKLLPLIRLRLGRSLRSQLESRDILQNVLLKAHARLDEVRDPDAVMAWMARIAEHEIRDAADFHGRERRDAARLASLDQAADVPSPVRQALSVAILNEQAARLERALEALTEAQREIIVLRKLEELSFPEIARRLGKTEDACRMAFARAMSALTLEVATHG